MENDLAEQVRIRKLLTDYVAFDKENKVEPSKFKQNKDGQREYVAFDKENKGETSNKTKTGKVITVKLIQLYSMVWIHLEKILINYLQTPNSYISK